MTLFVYLLYGRSPAAEREWRYALETLRSEIAPTRHSRESGNPGPPHVVLPLGPRFRGDDSGRVVLYTDKPQDFDNVQTVDAREMIAAAGEYRHAVKPRVLADALRRFGQDCVMLDLDGFVRPGFVRDVEKALAQGAAMNQFVRTDPYPCFPDFQTELPHLGRYRLDRQNAKMLNSGLVAVRAQHLPLIEDAVVLMDRLWAAGLHKHDIEQFAVGESLRRGGVEIALIHDTFEHYCPRWSRRYMRRRLRRRAPGARIPYSKTRVRLFKAYWTLRLAMRKARRSWRGLWRKT